MDTYCLNLHERYVPEWGAWECARELFANAKDAAPKGLKIVSPDADTLEIYTPTVPRIAELFIIGCGSKSPEDANIGQFGEGVKLAALAATRAENSSLVIRTPEDVITFELKEHFGERVLFANVSPSNETDGCACVLKMPGAGYALNGKIIDGESSRMFSKPREAEVQIFCKGVWICALRESQSLFSYNLNDIELNRDRSHAAPWSIREQVGYLLLREIGNGVEHILVKHPRSWESSECLDAVDWRANLKQKETLASAFRALYDDKCVISTDPSSSQRARKLGYVPVSCGTGLTALLQGLIPTDASLSVSLETLNPVKIKDAWREAVDELEEMAMLVDLEDVEIRVFKDRHSDLIGKADVKHNVVWLNERLFASGNRFERLRTFFHELGHIQSSGSDATTIFEASLDLLGAKLALHIFGD